VRLVKLRGESMQAAADAQPSGMVSVIGLSADKVGAGAQCWNSWLGGMPYMLAPLQGWQCAQSLTRLICPVPTASCQVAELCEAASAEVPAGQGVRIANYLCNGEGWVACELGTAENQGYAASRRFHACACHGSL